MLDIRFIREHATRLQDIATHKGIEVSIADLLQTDTARRQLLQDVEQLRQQRNTLSQQMPTLAQTGRRDEMEATKALVRTINADLAAQEAQLAVVQTAYDQLMLLVPNIVSPDTPLGATEDDNVQIRQFGTPTTFDFEPRDHVQLSELHDLMDIQRGVKVAGTRNYYLKGMGVHLQRAVQQLALDLLTDRGFTVMDVPLMAREEMLTNTGFFPLGREQTYQLEREEKWLVGTSEVPLVSYHAGEVVDVTEPLRYSGISNCFRREAGSAGRDVRGLYRVHQFAKVEQVVITAGDVETSNAVLDEITANAEAILQLLELPYRVVAVCTGDMAIGTYKKFDIETWMPSRGTWGETQSASNMTDFQARRSQIRYRDAEGELRYCHTLNSTAVATPRLLIPLLENHQRADGSVYIPVALRPYLRGVSELR